MVAVVAAVCVVGAVSVIAVAGVVAVVFNFRFANTALAEISL